MTLRLEAYFEDQIKSILSSHKSKGKRNPSKATPRPAKRKAAPPAPKVSSGRAGPSQPPATSQRASPAFMSTDTTRRLPALPALPTLAPSKKGAGPSKTTSLSRVTGPSRPTTSRPKSTWGWWMLLTLLAWADESQKCCMVLDACLLEGLAGQGCRPEVAHRHHPCTTLTITSTTAKIN